MSLDDARRKCEAWRRDYNEERPLTSSGGRTSRGSQKSVNRTGSILGAIDAEALFQRLRARITSM